MNVLNRIKLKISREEVDYSNHVLDNLDDLNLTKDDINHTISTCAEIKKEVDFVSTKYVILGLAIDGMPTKVVCAFRNELLIFISIHEDWLRYE